MLFEPFDKAYQAAADMAGLNFDQMALILNMGVSTFVGIGLNVILGLNLPRFVRYTYIIATGIFLQCFMYRWQSIHIFIMAGVSFLCMTYLPRDF